MNISDIRIGERHRKDLGDIASLAQSIADIGLLHPVVVTPDGTPVCSFSVATDRRWTDASGQQQERIKAYQVRRDWLRS